MTTSLRGRPPVRPLCPAPAPRGRLRVPELVPCRRAVQPPQLHRRTGSQARKPGFELVTATSDGALAGFSFGYPIPAAQWWSDCTPPPREVLDSAKFAVIELDVRQSWRGEGVGKELLGTLLDGRAEKFATLAATPGSPAHAMYLRWGWSKAGEFCTPPVMDAMIIGLGG
jgi:GNAT superfamily N-acetyltransferase